MHDQQGPAIWYLNEIMERQGDRFDELPPDVLDKLSIAAAGLLSFIFCWNNFVFALILASADKQPVTVGSLAFVTASGIQYGQIAAAVVLSITPTLLLALFAQRYLVEGLSLGAVKG